MPIEIKNEFGKIVLNEDVIASIVGNSANNAYGIVGMVSDKSPFNILKFEGLSKGVKVEEKNGKLNIDIYVVIQFGTKISEVAKNTIELIKYDVERFTNIEVENVNINIESMKINK